MGSCPGFDSWAKKAPVSPNVLIVLGLEHIDTVMVLIGVTQEHMNEMGLEHEDKLILTTEIDNLREMLETDQASDDEDSGLSSGTEEDYSIDTLTQSGGFASNDDDDSGLSSGAEGEDDYIYAELKDNTFESVYPYTVTMQESVVNLLRKGKRLTVTIVIIAIVLQPVFRPVAYTRILHPTEETACQKQELELQENMISRNRRGIRVSFKIRHTGFTLISNERKITRKGDFEEEHVKSMQELMLDNARPCDRQGDILVHCSSVLSAGISVKKRHYFKLQCHSDWLLFHHTGFNFISEMWKFTRDELDVRGKGDFEEEHVKSMQELMFDNARPCDRQGDILVHCSSVLSADVKSGVQCENLRHKFIYRQSIDNHSADLHSFRLTRSPPSLGSECKMRAIVGAVGAIVAVYCVHGSDPDAPSPIDSLKNGNNSFIGQGELIYTGVLWIQHTYFIWIKVQMSSDLVTGRSM